MDGYPSRVATDVTGATTMQLAYWQRTGLVEPSVSPGRGRGSARLYSFRNLVQLAVVRQLLGAGVSLQRVRKSVAYLRKHFPDVSHPLAQLTLLTDGDSVFHLTDDPKLIVDTVRHAGQVVFSLKVGGIVNEVRSLLERIPIAQTRAVTVGDFEFPVRLTPDPDDGGYLVECPGLPGCVSQGDSLDEAMSNIADAARGWLAANRAEESKGNVRKLPLNRFRRRATPGVKRKVSRAAAR